MKRALLLVLLLALAGSAYAGGWFNWFHPIMNLKSTYVVEQGTIDHPVFEDGALPDHQVRFDIIVGAVLFDWVFAEVEVETFNGFLDFNPQGGSFTPYQSDYGFRGGIQKYGVRLGYEHWCFHPVIGYNSFVWKGGGSDTFFLDFDLKRLIATNPDMIATGYFQPLFGIGIAYSPNHTVWLSNRINKESIGKPESKRIQVRALAGFKAWIIWTEAEVAINAYPGIETVLGVDGMMEVGLRGGIDIAGVRIGYEYAKNVIGADGFVPELSSQTVYIEFDLERINTETIRRNNRR